MAKTCCTRPDAPIIRRPNMEGVSNWAYPFQCSNCGVIYLTQPPGDALRESLLLATSPVLAYPEAVISKETRAILAARLGK